MAVIEVLTKNGSQPKTAPVASGSANVIPVLTKSKPTPLSKEQRALNTVNRAFNVIGAIKKNPKFVEKPETPKTIFSSFEKLAGDFGRLIQKTPNLDLGTKSKGLISFGQQGVIKLGKKTTEEKITNFISNMPSSFLQSWGQTIEQLSTEEGRKRAKQDAINLPKTMGEVKTAIDNKDWQKAFEVAMSNSAITIALDVSDVIPVGLLAKLGLKPLKSLTKSRTLAKKIVTEAIEETEEKVVKTIAKPKTVEVKPKPNVVKPLLSDIDPLVNEARKYKSADEFIKSQPVVYHGSQTPIKKFDNKKGGVFFTDDMMNADGYANGENVYEGVLNFKKPLVIDAKGRMHNDLKTPYGTDTESVVANIDKNKYDGVIFKNVKDSWIDDADVDTPSTIYYAFKPQDAFLNESQLTDIWKKSSSPLPQGGAGKVVKPKEVKVPREQLPVKQGQSRVFERLQKENPEQLKGELPFDQAVLKTEFDKAANRITKNKQDAYDIAMNRKNVTDIESVTTNIEMAEKALADGNNILYEKLIRNRSIAQTRRGQAIVAEKASIEDNSTARYVKELLSARLDNLGKRYLSGLKEGTAIRKHATEVIDRKVGALQVKIQRGKLDTRTALKLLDELACI